MKSWLFLIILYASACYSIDNHGENIWKKLKFPCEIVHYGKSSIFIFKEPFSSIGNIFFSGVGAGHWAIIHEVLTLLWTFLIF